MNAIVRAAIAVSMSAVACLSLQIASAQSLSRPNPETDMSAPENNPTLQPNAALGSQYPSHGNQQAGELNLNPTDPRAQLANGLPNNALGGGYGSPLAGSKVNVKPDGQTPD
jgi:hypothetical protein